MESSFTMPNRPRAHTRGGTGERVPARRWFFQATVALRTSLTTCAVAAATLIPRSIPAQIVSPNGESLTAQANTSSNWASFSVYNVMGFTDEISLTCQVTGVLTGCWVQPSITLQPDETGMVMVSFDAGNPGSGNLILFAEGSGGSDDGWYVVTVTEPPPQVNVDPAATNNDNQAMNLCDAQCFAATYSHSTVPYFSMDQPRQVTLIYHGDRIALRPFVHVDVAAQPGSPTISEFWLEAKKGDGSSIQFLNGETLLKFAGTNSQQVRLGAQFDAAQHGMTQTAMHPVSIIVTTRFVGGSQEVKTINTSVMVVNERASQVARGWSIAGLQRLYPQSDGTVLITEGDGSATLFNDDCGPGCFSSPAGDFSKLTLSGSVYTRAYPDSTKAAFSSSGFLTSVTDPFGNAIGFVYSGGRLTEIEDPFMRWWCQVCFNPFGPPWEGIWKKSSIKLSYGSNGLASITEPRPNSGLGGRATIITVAADSTLTAIQDPDGISTGFGYDGLRRLHTVTDRRGGITTYNYHPSGKLESVDLPTVTLFDGSNVSPRVSYSSWHTVSVPTGPTSGTPFTPVATANVLGTATDPLGRQVSFISNRWGQPLRINEPLGRTTTITRTGIFPTNVQRPTGANDVFGFTGALVTSQQPAGQTLQNIRYGGWALPDSIWGTGRVPQRRFISSGKVDSIRIASSNALKMRFTYDARGRVLTATDPENHVTSYHYDAVFGNLDSTLAPGGRFTKVTFDTVGRLKTQQSNDEPQRQVVYDAVNRVREVHDGINASPTRYTYDQLFLTLVEDPKGQFFRFENNALGWVTRKYDPADTVGRYDTFGYDSAGNVRRWTNRRGQQINYTYDALNRPLTKSGTNTTTDSLWYSSDGLKMAAWNFVSRDSVYLRTDGWVDSVITFIAGRKFKRIYRPNNVQQLDSVKFSNDAGITFAPRHYGWNRQTGALDTVSINGQITRFARNNDLLPLQTIWPSLTRTAQWTSIHRPGEQTFSVGAVNDALFRRYSYDSRAGLRDRIRWEGGNFRTQQAGYDGLRRLGNQGNNLYATSQCVWNVASGYLCPLAFQHTLTYDPGGNRTDVANTSYATGNRVQSFGIYNNITHDLDGNVTQKYNTSTGETKQFEWSAEGLLTRVLVNGIERVRYDYNVAGLLVRRSTSGSLDRHFLWDQRHLLVELDGTATQRIGEYAYLPGADRPVALITGVQSIAAVRYAVQDEVGNVIGLLNGTVMDQQVAYDDWGVPTVTGSADNRLLFKGLLWESNYTGMYYVRARWYDPELGRFISEDPRGISEGTNYYSFAGSDAVNGWDPTGQWKLKNFIKSVFKAVSIIAPIVAFNSILAGPGLTSAVKALGGAALGSAVGAGIERAVAKHSFWPAFWRNFGVASLSLAIGGVYAGYHGQKFIAGERNLITGFVRLLPGSEKPWGLTLGSGILFGAPTSSVLSGGLVTLGQHEFGHALQFLALSALPSGPIGMYSALGLAGIAGQFGAAGVVPFVGCLWEGLAGLAGSLGAGTSSCAGLQQ
jgi:RHS repeat-associated protein